MESGLLGEAHTSHGRQARGRILSTTEGPGVFSVCEYLAAAGFQGEAGI